MLAQENNPNELVNLPELDAFSGKDKALRRAFVINYVNDPKRNGTKAAIRAGYSAGEKNASAMVTASRLLRDVKVLAAIKAVEEYFVGPNLKAEIVAKLRAIMRGDITDVMAWDESGNIKLIPSDELSPEAAAAVSQITGFKEEKQGRFDFGDKKDVEMEKVRQQVKMHDPLKAADLLAKIGGFAAPEKMELSADFSGEINHNASPAILDVLTGLGVEGGSKEEE